MGSLGIIWIFSSASLFLTTVYLDFSYFCFSSFSFLLKTFCWFYSIFCLYSLLAFILVLFIKVSIFYLFIISPSLTFWAYICAILCIMLKLYIRVNIWTLGIVLHPFHDCWLDVYDSINFMPRFHFWILNKYKYRLF